MKKIALLLVITLVLGLSVVAHAGATKYTLTQGFSADGTESGFVVVNFPKEGKAIGQFQVRGLDPNKDYWAYYYDPAQSPEVIGMVKVNKRGSGHLHVATDEAVEIPGFWLGIADTDTGITSADVVLYTWVVWP